MKTLYLVRHAKSAWDHPDLADFDRPLNSKGYADAHMVSKQLSEQNIHIEVLISSPAIRALSTALIFAGNLAYSFDAIQIRTKLYDSGLAEYLECIAQIGSASSALLVGHNETLSVVAQKLAAKPLNTLKTCSVIGFQWKINLWKDIHKSKGILIFKTDSFSKEEK